MTLKRKSGKKSRGQSQIVCWTNIWSAMSQQSKHKFLNPGRARSSSEPDQMNYGCRSSPEMRGRPHTSKKDAMQFLHLIDTDGLNASYQDKNPRPGCYRVVLPQSDLNKEDKNRQTNKAKTAEEDKFEKDFRADDEKEESDLPKVQDKSEKEREILAQHFRTEAKEKMKTDKIDPEIETFIFQENENIPNLNEEMKQNRQGSSEITSEETEELVKERRRDSSEITEEESDKILELIFDEESREVDKIFFSPKQECIVPQAEECRHIRPTEIESICTKMEHCDKEVNKPTTTRIGKKQTDCNKKLEPRADESFKEKNFIQAEKIEQESNISTEVVTDESDFEVEEIDISTDGDEEQMDVCDMRTNKEDNTFIDKLKNSNKETSKATYREEETEPGSDDIIYVHCDVESNIREKQVVIPQISNNGEENKCTERDDPTTEIFKDQQADRQDSKTKGLEDHLKESNREENPSAHYKQCLLCWRTFLNQDWLFQHIRQYHFSSDDQSCHHCPRIFSRKTQLQAHLISHHPEVNIKPSNSNPVPFARVKKVSFVCDHCNEKFAGKKFYKLHISKFHKESQDSIRPLPQTPMSKIDSLNNSKSNNISSNIQNNSESSENSSLKPYTTRSGRKVIVRFDVDSPKVAKERIRLARMPTPKRFPNIEKPFQCGKCTKSYDRKYFLCRHITKKHLPTKEEKNSAKNKKTSVAKIRALNDFSSDDEFEMIDNILVDKCLTELDEDIENDSIKGDRNIEKDRRLQVLLSTFFCSKCPFKASQEYLLDFHFATVHNICTL